jgi:rare lipoprotein A
MVKLQTGLASYYADKYQGRRTANGEHFNQNAQTAAHRTLSFGTRVKVTNLSNGKSVIVRINDRGPFIKGRVINLSKSAFSTIANPRMGLIEVIVVII